MSKNKKLVFDRDELEKKMIRTNSLNNLSVDKQTKFLRKNKSDSNIQYSKKTEKTSRNEAKKNTKVSTIVKNTSTNKNKNSTESNEHQTGNIKSYSEYLKEMTQGYTKLTKKTKLSIKEYSYIRYLNNNKKIVSGYINKIYYDEKNNEIGWIISGYLNSTKTWCIFPLKIASIYIKNNDDLGAHIKEITQLIENQKQIISIMNKYLISKYGKNYIDYMDSNLK